ncbi:hypothetical protein D3C83_306720 [compost metagenome]
MAPRPERNGHRVNHDELVLLPELAHGRKPRREAEQIVQREELGFRVRERAPER